MIEYKTKLSAGMDLPLAESCIVLGNSKVWLDTGLYVADIVNMDAVQTYLLAGDILPYIQIKARSSTFKKEVTVWEGVIELDFPETIKIGVHNTSEDSIKFDKGDCIAQAMIQLSYRGLSKAKVRQEERVGGMGSTDKVESTNIPF